MNCPRCGSEIQTGQKFCAECGLALVQQCPSCGTPYEGSPKFCAECGHPLAQGRPTQPAADRAHAPQQAQPGVPADVPSAERRFVSVLFADLVGFTQLSEQRDPEQVRELLSQYFEVARQVVESYGGTVEKFIGDAVMAVWGAPTAHEDDAERAVRAALELVQAVSELGLAGQSLALRAGVLSGEAAVTPGRTGEGMVAGDVVNTASRLQSVAPPGFVLVGDATRNVTDAAIAYELAGDQLLRGKQAPVPAWRALRVVARVRGEGREEGLEPPFVGRHVELRLLKDQLHAAEEERRPRVVLITGQAGLGKSRLAWELEKYLDGLAGTTYYWHQGRSPAYGEGVTFWALGEMVRRRARIAEAEDAASTRAKLAASLADFLPDDAERRRLEPALGALLGIADVDWDAREQLFSAWRTFFERIADRGPSVLVFEDLQWADSGLLDFIDHLLDWTRDRPILIVALARPELLERRPDFGAGRGGLVSLHLEPLFPESMSVLLRGLVPRLPETDLQRIVARAEGVPLYAVETIRSLVDGGHLVRNGDIYDVAGDLPALGVPPTLRALIASRLDALQADDRSLLQDGAILGLAFSVRALASLAGRPTHDVEHRLRALAHKELLSLDTDPRSPERGQYRFRQELVREVAYATLSKRDRRARHVAAARYFEALGDDELAGVLANHYLEAYRAVPEGEEGAAVAAQARVALRGAAERASRLHSHEQALAYLELALAVTFDQADRVEVQLQASRSATPSGRLDKAEEYLRAAIEWYERNGERAKAAETSNALGHVLILNSRIDDAIELLERALSDLPPEAESLGAKLYGQLARAHLFRGSESEQGLEAIDRALVTAERLGMPTLQLLITKSWAASSVGRPSEGIALLRGVVAMADEQGETGARIRARYNLSSYLAEHDPHLGLRVGLEGIAISREFGDALTATNMAGNASANALIIGDLDRVFALEADSAEVKTTLSGQVLLNAAMAAALRGDGEGAHQRLSKARALGAHSTSAQDIGATRHAQAMVALGSGELDEARRLAREAREAFPGSDGALGAVLVCRIGALLADPVGLAADLAALRGLTRSGIWMSRAQREVSAAKLALDGQHEQALGEYRSVIAEWREADLHLDLALALIARAWLLGAADEEAAAGLDEARSLLANMGAEGLIDRLATGAGRAPTDAPATLP